MQGHRLVRRTERNGCNRYFFSSRRRHTRYIGDWSSDVCSSDLKRFAKAAGVPVVPGANSEVESAEEAVTEARKIGFPVLLKAAFGGGGRGMRIARTATELEKGFETARSEERRVGRVGRSGWSRD